MLPFKHFIPKLSTKYCQFKKNKHSVIENLNKMYAPIRFDALDINPYPLLFNKQLVYQINDCHSLLIEAIHQIVTHFFSDSALRQIISLNDQTLNLLHPLKDKPYEIGAIRPDFLFDKTYQLKICEINARFPMNAFILSQCIYDEIVKNFVDKISCLHKKMIKNFEILNQFFDYTQPIYILFDKEKSFDIFLLKNIWEKTLPNLKLKLMTPPECLFKNKFLDQRRNRFQGILNLHQEELLTLEPSLFNEITAQTYFNDIRTILIVHDKRLLSVLSNKTIMSRYISSEKYNRLATYIIPTYSLNDNTIENIKVNPKNWVLKKISAGKGEGMTIGKETPLAKFSTVLNEKKLDYIAQPFIEQPLFQLLNGSCTYQALYLVGTILSFNNILVGPGLLRGSHKTIINIAQGDTTIFTPFY